MDDELVILGRRRILQIFKTKFSRCVRLFSRGSVMLDEVVRISKQNVLRLSSMIVRETRSFLSSRTVSYAEL